MKTIERPISANGHQYHISIPVEMKIEQGPSHDSPENLQRVIRLVRDEPWYRKIRHLNRKIKKPHLRLHVIPRYSSSNQKIALLIGTFLTLGVGVVFGYRQLQKRYREQKGDV